MAHFVRWAVGLARLTREVALADPRLEPCDAADSLTLLRRR